METIVRPATAEDIPELRALIQASVNHLQATDYTESQRQFALGGIFGVDPLMIEDRTYFVAVSDSRISASGGWSRRATPFGSDSSPALDDRMLDPQHNAAKIRATEITKTKTKCPNRNDDGDQKPEETTCFVGIHFF